MDILNTVLIPLAFLFTILPMGAAIDMALTFRHKKAVAAMGTAALALGIYAFAVFDIHAAVAVLGGVLAGTVLNRNVVED